MHCERHKLGTWVKYCAALAICLGPAIPAFAQKFARRSRPVATSAYVVEEEVESEPAEAIETPPARIQETRPARVRETRPARMVRTGQAPWQEAPAPMYRPRVYRHRQPRMAMQEVVFTDGEPTLADSELIAPGMMEGEVIQEGVSPAGPAPEGYYEDEGEFVPGCPACESELFDDHVCGPGCNESNCPRRVVPCDGICIPRHRVEEHSLFIGPQGFKGPLDQGLNGNFGFHEGVNFAGQFGRWLGLGGLGIGYQVGAMFAQSDFYGNQVNGMETKGRDQQFVTAGLFRRARGYGFQGGAVFDYLHDNYYVKYNVGQVRAELSYLNCCGHEFGFFGAFAVRPGHGNLQNNTLSTVLTQGYQTIDYYNLFYRVNLPSGAWGRFWGGATGNKGGMVGADVRLPLNNRWDLTSMFNFLIPGPGAGLGGQSHEGWGLMTNLVWYPGRAATGVHNGYYRSLFHVANNGLMFVQPH